MVNARLSRTAHVVLHAVLPALLLLAGAACERGADTTRAAHPERLHGEWTVEFHLEHRATLTRDTIGPPPVNGSVVLLEDSRHRRIEGLSGPATHYGVYSADLRSLDLPATAQVPTLMARLARGDSVEFAFDPGQGHPFAGRGVLAGDSLTGQWWTRGGRTTGRSSGRFTMRRP
ncbi:hypothetical protein [Longimicrobium sp.]|jgi:hypothetical protein|uniref:hypothetical protein n=1 Tax=Longimicrobium sp. TaxID=2029185 RepID=UPI002EDB5A3F